MQSRCEYDSEVSQQRVRPSRAKRKKRKVVLGILPRFGLIACAVVVTGFVLFVFAARIAQPYAMQHQQAVQIRAAKTELAESNESNADLQSQIDFLKRPEGVAVQARAQGYLRPGEVSLEINAKPPAQHLAQRPGFAGLIQRAWSNWTHR